MEDLPENYVTLLLSLLQSKHFPSPTESSELPKWVLVVIIAGAVLFVLLVIIIILAVSIRLNLHFLLV